MGNCSGRLRVEAREQMTMSGAGASATTGETSSFHTAREEFSPSGQVVALGNRSSAGSSMARSSEYFSARVEEIMRSKSQFSSDVEREIERSREYWSEVRGHCRSEVSEECDHEEEDNDRQEKVRRENWEVFTELMNDPQWVHHKWGPFFCNWFSMWKLGRKIAEGGQAEIFEVLHINGKVHYENVFKVFKRGTRLSDLKTQWPCGILRGEVDICGAIRGFMLDDGRFAFLLVRCWGDLRKLIDQAMQEKNNLGPPFPYEWNGETMNVTYIMGVIALAMRNLHEKGIIHGDLKSANILITLNPKDRVPVVVDYECSIGVVGTRFWRAPEILLALKNGSAIDYTPKMDVYSFGMVWFEVITGRLPFEGELQNCRASRDLIIGGQRPKLPSDLDVKWKNLIERCWNPIPSERPSFEEILHSFGFRCKDL